jgi:hypothetical protein
MEVEQRIGRVDRFGQTEEKILILNFHTPGTIESNIIQRVHERIGVFKDSIGELEPILQSQLSDLRRTMFDFSLTEAERQRRLDEMLAAIEEHRLALEDVESAASYLTSTDRAEIDGLERDLLANGRYIGQPELVHLLSDWASNAPGARCSLDKTQTHLTFRGTAALEVHLRSVQAAGERSRSEIDDLAKAMLDERDLVLCLDQEHARTTGHQLLAATHPLVRAALRVPGSSQARYSAVRIRTPEVPEGRYLVLIAVSRWDGIQPSAEFWTTSVNLDSGRVGEEDAGAALLAALAESRLETAGELTTDLSGFLRQGGSELRRRQEDEAERRQAVNESLVETRRISLRETHSRKIAQIDRRIRTLRERGSTGVVHLQEAQRANQDRLLRDAEARLEEHREGVMNVEPVAVCLLEVVAQ